MIEEAIKEKKRQQSQRSYVINKAEKVLKESDYRTTFLKDNIFDLEGIRDKEVRRIRVVLEKIDDSDRKFVKENSLPNIYTKEIWVAKKTMFGKLYFKIETIS